VQWYDLTALKALMNSQPDSFTPGFRETIRRFY
jgi:hypothetical protein